VRRKYEEATPLQNRVEGTVLRRLTAIVLVMFGAIDLVGGSAGAASVHGRQITDSKYSISFVLPTTWKHPVTTMRSNGTTKLLVQDVSGSSILGLVQVQIINGRHTNASIIATGLVQGTPGAEVLGSSIAKFSFGKAEQLRFSIQTPTKVVYGIADAFYLHKRTYIVAFDSVDPAVNAKSRAVVMGSWSS
jgi:hypothetical protein